LGCNNGTFFATILRSTALSEQRTCVVHLRKSSQSVDDCTRSTVLPQRRITKRVAARNHCRTLLEAAFCCCQVQVMILTRSPSTTWSVSWCGYT